MESNRIEYKNDYTSELELGRKTRAVEKDLKTLQKEGKIKRIGPDKGGYWEVISG
jgi:ATP-dependent DNA helicase RecG